MNTHLEVTYTGISDIATRFAIAAADLGAWSRHVPVVPASGPGARQAAAITEHLVTQIAHLTRTIESASEALDDTRAAYEAVDERSRSRGTVLMVPR